MISVLHLDMVNDSFPEIFTGIYLGTVGVLGFFYCLVLILALFFFVVWLWLLIDCLRRNNYDGPNDKLLWALLMIFAGIIGSALYYFIVKMKKDEKQKAKQEASSEN